MGCHRASGAILALTCDPFPGRTRVDRPLRTPASPTIAYTTATDCRREAMARWRPHPLSLVARAGDWQPSSARGGSVTLFVLRVLRDPSAAPRAGGREVPRAGPDLTGSTLAVHGLAARRVAVIDSLVVAAGAPGRSVRRRCRRHPCSGPRSGGRVDERTRTMNNGGLIVDPPGAPRDSDRVLIIGLGSPRPAPAGVAGGGLLSIDGLPRRTAALLAYTLGDRSRWRVVDTSTPFIPCVCTASTTGGRARRRRARSVYWPTSDAWT